MSRPLPQTHTAPSHEHHRVNRAFAPASDVDLEMQVRSGAVAGRADHTDHLPNRNGLPFKTAGLVSM